MILRRLDKLMRRIIDLLGAGVGLFLFTPLLAVVAIAIRFSDGGPVLYRAKRVGRYGTHFGLYKFRTMVPNAAQRGPGITTNGDARITPLGRWLRRTKLDELPQLLNVLRGEMSLVGPRPEDPRYVAHYQPTQSSILAYRPGITSAASLAYRHEEQMLAGADWEQHYVHEIMPVKIALDLDYMTKRSVVTDCILIVRTIAAMRK
ncbi:MAG: sugar transferase [Candidatus Viridilinea halotolerans]|uniref:Sugar transferase n=1 Tax=Candidatus Viridilinea halotolerans TaxID=2491704 RepID=A0A426UC38_9CHLR|nr:MAG: sugar transferase [Candidatus Viridilinea halotolerans]